MEEWLSVAMMLLSLEGLLQQHNHEGIYLLLKAPLMGSSLLNVQDVTVSTTGIL